MHAVLPVCRGKERLKITRKLIFALIAVAVLACASFFLFFDEKERPTNVLLIVLDTVRNDAISTTRYGGNTLTPNIDAVAREGVTFSHTFSNAPWTLPSHGSIFTGLYPCQHHAVMYYLRLSRSCITMADALKAEGYRTGGLSCNPWVSRITNMNQGFDYFEELFTEETKFITSTDTTDKAISWIFHPEKFIEEEAGDDKAQPFFLFINFINAHLPYSPPRQFLSDLLPDGINKLSRQSFSIEEYREIFLHYKNLDPEELREIQTLYDAEIRYADYQLGQILNALREADLLDHTLVIITADHGEHMGEKEYLGHDFSVHQVLLRVPLIIRYPGVFPKGLTVDTNVSLIDIFPTLVHILDMNPSLLSGLPGKNLLPLVKGEATDRPSPLVAEYYKPDRLIQGHWQPAHPDYDFSRFDQGYKVLIDGKYKYALRDDGTEYLYDLELDSGEEKNLASDEPQISQKMKRQLQGILFAGSQPIQKETTIPDEETREALRALGYM